MKNWLSRLRFYLSWFLISTLISFISYANDYSDESQINVSITGIAGPKGGSKLKPVGLVFVGINYKGKNNVYKYLFLNKTRRSIQKASAKAVVDNLLKFIK